LIIINKINFSNLQRLDQMVMIYDHLPLNYYFQPHALDMN